MTNLQPAIDYFGNQAKLARAMGLDPMSVTQWKRRGLPLKRAIEISKLTNGTVKPVDLLPQYFS
jgi:DNA-binding transcriptional regulator YdaS (Cro superfamily)